MIYLLFALFALVARVGDAKQAVALRRGDQKVVNAGEQNVINLYARAGIIQRMFQVADPFDRSFNK